MDNSARIAELRCSIADHFYRELQEEQYMIDTCSDRTDHTKEYSLLIDLLENEPFLGTSCLTKDIK